MALKLAKVQYEHREVMLRNKPEQMLETSPKGSVPVFVTQDGTVIDESLDIIRWAHPNEKLSENFIESIDGPFKHHLDRYKYWSRYDENAKRGDVNLDHRAKAVNNLKEIEATLSKQRFLSGQEMGLSDIAVFPFIRQFAAVEPEWWQTQSSLPQMREWLKACVESKLFNSVMEKRPVWEA